MTGKDYIIRITETTPQNKVAMCYYYVKSDDDDVQMCLGKVDPNNMVGFTLIEANSIKEAFEELGKKSGFDITNLPPMKINVDTFKYEDIDKYPILHGRHL